MAVSFSTISGTSYPSWLSTFQTSLGHPILHGSGLFNHTSSFSSIPGASYPGWLSAFQPSLEQPILHGCQLFKHLWDIHSWMAVSFSTIPETTFPAWLSASQSSLGHPTLHLQPSLEQSILRGCQLFEHLCGFRSCMAVSFSNISGASYPPGL